MQKSLGLIETQGLAAGIEAADAAVKSANVRLIGYELTKGGGWTTVKVEGDVGAVKAAVDAARIAASKVNRVVSTRVIPRPAAGLDMLIHNGDTVGDMQPPEGPDMPPEPTGDPKGKKGEPSVEEKAQTAEPERTSGSEEDTEALHKAAVSAEEAPAEDTQEETAVQDAEDAQEESAEIPAQTEEEGAVKAAEDAEPETGADTDAQDPAKEEPADAKPLEEGEESPQEPEAPKPARRTSSKGRKGGKRSSKQENKE